MANSSPEVLDIPPEGAITISDAWIDHVTEYLDAARKNREMQMMAVLQTSPRKVAAMMSELYRMPFDQAANEMERNPDGATRRLAGDLALNEMEEYAEAISDQQAASVIQPPYVPSAAVLHFPVRKA